MKIASVSDVKKELKHLEKEELTELLINLMKFSKDNKELLNYLLFEADFESNYVDKIKEEIGMYFDQMDSRSWKMAKKPLQKVVRLLKKYIKYSKKATTEIELLLYFCTRMKNTKLSMKRNPVVLNIYLRQLNAIDKAMLQLHEDLRIDYQDEVEEANTF